MKRSLILGVALAACGKSEPAKKEKDKAPVASEAPALVMETVTRPVGALAVTTQVPKGWDEIVDDPNTRELKDPTGGTYPSAIILHAGCLGPCPAAPQTLAQALEWQLKQHEDAGFGPVNVIEQKSLDGGGFELALELTREGVDSVQYVRSTKDTAWPSYLTCEAIAVGPLIARRAELRASCEGLKASAVR